VSRGYGTHQRVVLELLAEPGWLWVTDLPYSSRSDYSSFWRAIRRLEAQGHVRVEHRRRAGTLQPRALLVNVPQFRSGTAVPIPIDEPYWLSNLTSGLTGTMRTPDG